jgi:hypothetical protein
MLSFEKDLDFGLESLRDLLFVYSPFSPIKTEKRAKIARLSLDFY